MNQYPVVFISFKDIDGNTFEAAYGYHKEMLEVMKAMLSTALKTNDHLEFGIVTGSLR